MPANDLITAWTLEKTKSRAVASAWLNEQVAKYPGNRIVKWCEQVFENRPVDITAGTNAEVRIIQRLIQIQ